MTPSTDPPDAPPPDTFVRAVEGLRSPCPRPEIIITELPPPQRLAPYTYALGANVHHPTLNGELAQELATGRLILLHDPVGHETWHGTLRLVTYVTAELEPDLVADPLLPDVGWSWLTDALDMQGAAYTAIGGAVTQTMSTRFGALAGPPTAADIEIRASWTPLPRRGSFGPGDRDDLAAHQRAWLDLLASTAGLPPPGVSALPGRHAGAV